MNSEQSDRGYIGKEKESDWLRKRPIKKKKKRERV